MNDFRYQAQRFWNSQLFHVTAGVLRKFSQKLMVSKASLILLENSVELRVLLWSKIEHFKQVQTVYLIPGQRE